MLPIEDHIVSLPDWPTPLTFDNPGQQQMPLSRARHRESRGRCSGGKNRSLETRQNKLAAMPKSLPAGLIALTREVNRNSPGSRKSFPGQRRARWDIAHADPGCHSPCSIGRRVPGPRLGLKNPFKLSFETQLLGCSVGDSARWRSPVLAPRRRRTSGHPRAGTEGEGRPLLKWHSDRGPFV